MPPPAASEAFVLVDKPRRRDASPPTPPPTPSPTATAASSAPSAARVRAAPVPGAPGVDTYASSSGRAELPGGTAPASGGTTVLDARLGRVGLAPISEAEATVMATSILATMKPALEAAARDVTPMVDFSVDEASLCVRREAAFDGVAFYTLQATAGAIAAVAGNRDALAIRLAHEVGHVLGAGPLDDVHELAVEGEADYRSAEILRRAFAADVLPWPAPPATKSDRDSVRAYFKARGAPDGPELDVNCRVALAALASLRELAPGLSFADAAATFPDVAKTSSGYPANAVRLQTCLAALVGDERPRAWAAPADFASAAPLPR